MKNKLLTLTFALSLLVLGAGAHAVEDSAPEAPTAPEFGTTIAEAACDALYSDTSTRDFCNSECRSKNAQELGACIKRVMADGDVSESVKQAITRNVGDKCYNYCNGGTCKKVFGVGGDANCKAVCCAAKAKDRILKCCTAAKDEGCSGCE